MLAVALTPWQLVAYLQRSLDVRVPMLSELMSSFGETNAANFFNYFNLVPESRGFHFARGPGIQLRGHKPPEPASCSTRCPPPRRVHAPETGRAKRPTYPQGESN